MNKGIEQIKLKGRYCLDNTTFPETKACIFLYEGKGALHPFCLKLDEELDWDESGRILKKCEEVK